MRVAAGVVVPVGIDDAWRVWSAIDQWPEWNPVYLSTEIDGEATVGANLVFQMRHPRGRPFWTRPVLTTISPPTVLAWTAKGMGLRARSEIRLAPHSRGTRLRMEMESTGAMGFAYRIAMTKKVQSRLILDTLDAFAAKMSR